MNELDYLKAAASLFHEFTFQKVVPLAALVAMLASIAWLLYRAQKKPDFKIEEMFKDDAGKVSSVRIMAFGAWAFTSWDLMAARLSGAVSPEHYWGYILAWSSSLVLAKLADKWDGSMPFGKGKQP